MALEIPFVKIHGAGNDFILIDNRPAYFTGSEQPLFRQLCRRKFGMGADGVMLVNFQNLPQFELQYFNADGYPAAMCGNGARCAVYFVHQLSPALSAYHFLISGVHYRGEITGARSVRIYWEYPLSWRLVKEWPVPGTGEFSELSFVNTGVPHLVIAVASDLEALDVNHWGPFFRHHRFFQPEGTNVDFIRVADGRIHIRTYERGIEGETLACGTGVLAAAAAAWYRQGITLPVEIVARGGNLRVGRTESEQWWLEGDVQPVYQGKFNPEHFM